MRRARAIATLTALVLGLSGASAIGAGNRVQIVGFNDLLGWHEDDHRAALQSFVNSCVDIRKPGWQSLCALAQTKPDAKAFFETFFTPVVIRPNAKALFTGYYEPILRGSLYREGPYIYPIYQMPSDLTPRDMEFTREKIENGALAQKGLEIAYVDDPVEAHFLHIQGSGQIQLSNGNRIRVGYAGENGHVYRSAPSELIRLGEISRAEASIAGLKAWVKRNPEKGIKALQFNASYVFFRRLETLQPGQGPLGALERPMMPLRSVAVDPRYVQMGAPVWIEKGGTNVIRKLMIAQDVGASIKGPQRADIFFGSGAEAGDAASDTNYGGRMVVLMPVAIAREMAAGR